MLAKQIGVTEGLLYDLYKAQLDHVRDSLVNESAFDYQGTHHPLPYFRKKDYTFPDDSHDGLSSAFEIAEVLRAAYYEDDREMVSAYLNTAAGRDVLDSNGNSYKVTPLSDHACDGICNALYKLNCLALPGYGYSGDE